MLESQHFPDAVLLVHVLSNQARGFPCLTSTVIRGVAGVSQNETDANGPGGRHGSVDAATVETETEAAAAAAAEREKPSTKAVLLRGAGLGELMSVVVSTLAAPLHVLTRPHAPAPAVAHAAQLVSDEAAAVAAAVCEPPPPSPFHCILVAVCVCERERESSVGAKHTTRQRSCRACGPAEMARVLPPPLTSPASCLAAGGGDSADGAGGGHGGGHGGEGGGRRPTT